MSAALRSGIIGTGFIGGVHARAVHAAGGTLTAVADSSPETAERGRERLMAGRAAASAQELIESDDVDVVHVCRPNHLHAPLAEQALAAGKHVVCEKPLATTLDEAQHLVDLADKAGVVTAVPFVYRYYPTVREVRARVRAGEPGPLWLLHGSYLQDWLVGDSESSWRVDPALGGASRAFADIGVHWCDLMEFATGHRITSLTAVLASAYDERRGPDGAAPVATEDGAALLFRTDEGATGSLVASQVSPRRKNRLWFSFDGTSASYSFDQELPDSLWVGAARCDEVTAGRTGHARLTRALRAWWRSSRVGRRPCPEGGGARSKVCKGSPFGPLRGPSGSPSRRDRRVARTGWPPGRERPSGCWPGWSDRRRRSCSTSATAEERTLGRHET